MFLFQKHLQLHSFQKLYFEQNIQYDEPMHIIMLIIFLDFTIILELDNENRFKKFSSYLMQLRNNHLSEIKKTFH